MTGTDTSAGTLAFGTWHLLNNPHHLRMLQEELKKAIPKSDDLSTIEQGWVELEKLDFLVSDQPSTFRHCVFDEYALTYIQRAVVKESYACSTEYLARIPELYHRKVRRCADNSSLAGLSSQCLLTLTNTTQHISPHILITSSGQNDGSRRKMPNGTKSSCSRLGGVRGIVWVKTLRLRHYI